jgi:hypothetical protein
LRGGIRLNRDAFDRTYFHVQTRRGRATWTGMKPTFVERPTGVGRAFATYEITIEGRDEWLAAARRSA